MYVYIDHQKRLEFCLCIIINNSRTDILINTGGSKLYAGFKIVMLKKGKDNNTHFFLSN